MFGSSSFQQTIATGKFTLPIVLLLSLVAWMLCPGEGVAVAASELSDYGLWYMLPESITTGLTSVVIGPFFSLLAVYLMTEFNNQFVLLRVSSRMLGSLLAVLLTASVFLHSFQPAHVVLLLILLSYFPLFVSYQQPDSMVYIFVAYMLLGIASLVFPKLLLVTPLYWLAQMVLRSFNPRTFFASVFGVAVPYWIAFSVVYVNDLLPEVYARFAEAFVFAVPVYSVWSIQHICVVAFAFLLSMFGIVNFLLHGYLDKTRTRVFLNVVTIFTLFSFLFLLLEPSHINVLLPFALVNTSIMAGHHLAQNFSRFNNIYTIIVCLIAAMLMVLEWFF